MKPTPTIDAHLSHPDLKVPDPYRIFFPLGIGLSFIGVAVWPMLALGWISYPNPLWHIDLMLQGFLFAFILGFLLTALPRFSQTRPIQKSELACFLIFFVAGNIATLMEILSIGRIAFWLNLTCLFIFAYRRFARRGAHPPPEFIFVGIGLLIGWIASWIRMDAYLPFSFGLSEVMGRRLITEGMVTMLILGIGGKLAPMFFGFSKANPLTQLGNASTIYKKMAEYGLIALILIMTFVVEYGFGQVKMALYLRALVVTFVFLTTMKIHRNPISKGLQVQLLRWSSWAVCFALWGAAIHPEFRIDVLHVLFIGGFGMMILAIATRVVLSHGKYSLEFEKNSPWLGFAGVVLFCSLIIRSIATLSGKYYFTMLGLAGGLWIIGLLLWGWFFVPKAIKINNS